MSADPLHHRIDRRDVWFIAIVVLAALAMRLPSVWTPPLTDDLVQHGMVAGLYGGNFAPWDLYAILPSDPAIRAHHMEAGLVPWWTSTPLDGHMFRPLTSVTLWFDHTVFPRGFVVHHVHTLLWWGLVLVIAGIAVRLLLPRPMAWLALVFFAVDHGVSLPLAWHANRSVLVGAALGLFAVFVHLRWRGGRRGAVWSALAMTLAFMAGEYAYCAVAYVVAFELFARRNRGLRGVAVSLMPALVPTLLYSAVHVAGGHGIQGRENYIHPVHSPSAYLEHLLVRGPMALAELVASIPSSPFDFGLQYTAEVGPVTGLPVLFGMHLRFVVAALVVAALATALAWRVWGDAERRTLVPLCAGAVLAVLPLAAAPMQGRLLLLPHVGGDAWAAGVVVAAARVVSGAVRAGWPRRVALGCIGLAVVSFHGVLDVRASLREMKRLRAMAESVPALVASLKDQGISIEGQRVVLLSSEVQSLMVHGTLIADAFGLEQPRSWHVVSATHAPLSILRTASNVLEVWHIKGETWLDDENDRMFCPPPWSIPTGTRVQTGAFEVEVLEDRQGRPTRIRLVFAQDLDAPGLVFLMQTRTGLHRFGMPAVGRMGVAPIPGPAWEAL